MIVYYLLPLFAAFISRADAGNCVPGTPAVTCTATASSVYKQFWSGALPAYWGANFAVDGSISYQSKYFFHSSYQKYPWLKMTMSAATAVNAIVFQTRCDANQWWHYQDVEFRAAAAATIIAIPGVKITTGTLCGNLQKTSGMKCGQYTQVCAAAIAAAIDVSAQMVTLDSDGGGFGQHSNVDKYFLMINELYIY